MVIGQLDRKLIRDIMHLKAQVISIAVVVAIGVAVLFGFTSTHKSLLESRDHFYEQANFADIFVNIKKAPLYAIKELVQIEGVALVEPRIEYDALLSIPDFAEPAVGHFVSIPDGGQPKMNQLALKKGRLPSAFSDEEVIVSEGFFEAHDFQLGDHFYATLNGRRKKFSIIGVGVTPEFTIALQGGAPVPDDFHFSVIWLNESILASTLDMRSSFNSALIKAKGNVNEDALIDMLDLALEKYGGIGAYGRGKQVSSVFVNEELKQLRVQATFIPIIFFLVVAFILNVVISRLVRVHRSQIATLKSLGYFNRSISAYYFKVSGLIVLIGLFLGIFMGIWIGDNMIRLYGAYYHFPSLRYVFDYNQILLAAVVAFLTAFIGVYSSLRKIFLLQPAEAMRPPSPEGFHGGRVEKSPLFLGLKARGRMMVRGVTAYPKRSIMTGTGMSLSIVLLVSGLFWQDSVDYLILAQYSFSQKETGSIQLTHAVSPQSVYEVSRLEGVLEASGYRNVPVKASFRNRDQTTVLKGYSSKSPLLSIINENLEEQYLPEGGIYVSRILANQLNAKEGDIIEVKVLEGRKPKFNLKVRRVIDSFMTNEILTSRKELARLLKSKDLINQILFRSFSDSTLLYGKLKEMPNVLAVSFRSSALKVFKDTSAKFLLVFAFILSLFAGAIGFGIAYNNMRVTLAERDWEMATLQILGFKISEVFRVLISEVLFLVVGFMPLGWLLGYLNARWLLEKLSMESFQIPFVIDLSTFFFATLIVLLSTGLSAILIYRMLSSIDLVSTLKSRS